MSIIIKKLTAKQCEQLKYNPKNKKLNYLRDGQGLYLEALPNGRKVWNFEFRLTDENNKSRKSRIRLPHDFGTDGGSVIDARAWREEQRKIVQAGINPTLHAKQEKARRQAKQKNTFDAVADEWLAHHKDRWSERHYKKAEGIVKRVLRVPLGDRVISEILAAEILAAVQVPESEDKRETAHKAMEFASQIFRRAIVRQLVTYDPTYSLRGTEGLKPKQPKNRPHLTDPEEIGELLRKIDNYNARHFSVLYALKILPHVFTRPTELSAAPWREFDLKNAQWEIPAERMKARRPHVVPLSTQVITLLEELALHSHHSPNSLLFPSPSNNTKPISDGTLSKALRSLGYAGRHVPHGFRHTANTSLNELQLFSPDAIELQQAHADKNTIRRTYNKAQYLPERRKMMQFWSEHIDGLKSGNPLNVVAIKGNKQ